jgi:hypothetical protein
MPFQSSPEVGEFFTQYPPPHDIVKELAEFTGYHAHTIQNWISGRIKPSRPAFLLLVERGVKPYYPHVDTDYVDLVAQTLSNRHVKQGRNLDPAGAPPPALQASRPPVVANVASSLVRSPVPGHAEPDLLGALASFDFLRAALRRAHLTADQKTELIRLLVQ